MKWAWLLVFTVGCSARIGNQPDMKASCQTAGWFVDGPSQIALYREATFRVKKCGTAITVGRLIWSVSDGSVIRVVSQSNDYARIKAVKYGNADVVVMGPSGQFVLSVTVE